MKNYKLSDEITLRKNFRIDNFCKIVRGNTGLKKDELLDTGDYVALQYGKTYKVDVVDETFNFFVNEEYFKESQVVNQGDTILISTSETIEDLGHSCFYDRNDLGLLGGEQILLKPKSNSINGKYLYYFSKFFKTELQKYATGLKVFRFNIDDLKRISFHIPPLPEQTAIANYLDRKTSTIDKKTELLNQKIETYKKLRKAIINKAVTKGLDNKVELKESEIDWIGKIPKHWEVKRVKDVSQLMTGNSISDKENFESNFDAYPYVSTKDIYLDSNEINYDNGIYVPKTDESFKILSKNSVLLCIEGANAGKKIGFSIRDVAFVNKLCGFTVIERFINPKYLFYYIISETFGNYFFPNLNGLIGGVSINKIKEFSVLLPTIKEQRQIADYLDQKTATIDKIVENLQTQITTLQHLRKVLINDAVTGKIKVV